MLTVSQLYHHTILVHYESLVILQELNQSAHVLSLRLSSLLLHQHHLLSVRSNVSGESIKSLDAVLIPLGLQFLQDRPTARIPRPHFGLRVLLAFVVLLSLLLVSETLALQEEYASQGPARW